PQGRSRYSASFRRDRPGERVDRRFTVSDSEVQVWKLGHSRKPDFADRLPLVDLLSRSNPHAAITKVAVHALPAVAVLDGHPVPPLPPLGAGRARAVMQAVGHPVADAPDLSLGSGDDGYPPLDRLQVGQRDIGPFVAF